MGFLRKSILEPIGAWMCTVFGTSKWNARYIRVINSCNWNDFVALMDDILDLDQPFRKKRYIWNVIRGKTFYKELSHYVIGYCERVMSGTLDGNRHKMNDIEMLIHEIVTTEKSERALKSFIWAITKKIPLLTIDTIPYMSAERITNILLGEKTVLNDATLEPFIDPLVDLRNQVAELTNMMKTVMGDE
ncbi:MAG: hypothetical protein NC311_05925 [Muribaculaceae bacterium]|nr:hypothetical protein [Muribaculaceae bacterium]